MPFKSKAQQRLCFATGKWDCKKWARQTDFKVLPERVTKKMK